MIKDVFSQITIPKTFTPRKIDQITKQLSKTIPESLPYNYGLTKLVLFLNKEQVLKIPFSGDSYITFRIKDYCKEESLIYESAVAAGLEKYFAKTIFFCSSKNKYPIYTSERIFFDGFYKKENSTVLTKERLQLITDLTEIYENFFEQNYIDIPLEWSSAAIDYYGVPSFKKFLEFLYDEDINDLHSGNLGFREDGSPAIFDYSGYWED